jgi:hypothetical protein
MLLFAPCLASITTTKPFSTRARAMISFFWIWMFIYNGLGYILLYRNAKKYEVLLMLAIPAGLTFTIMQVLYISMGYFEFVLSEIIWALSGLIWTIITVFYFIDKRKIKNKTLDE